jgi:chaperonin GroEL (HSP60 family)
MAIYLGHDVSSAVKEVLAEVEKIIKSSNESVLNAEKGKVLLKTEIQTCINHRFNDRLKDSIHKILMDHCFYSERLSPGGFRKTLMMISSLLNGSDHQDSEPQVFHPGINDLESLIHNSSAEKSISKLAIEAIRLAGFGGKVSIEKSVNSSTSIELIEGYVFKHKPVDLKPTKLTKPKVVCVDGYIESVSEVNMLFEGAVETKNQLLLISRGMHDDVINTIKVNRDRGTMFVYPVIINFDLDGINTLADISTVVGTNPVSCHLGELISSIKISDAVEIDESTIIGNSITFKNSRTRHNVNVHVRNLIEKRQNSNSNIDIEDLLTTRIKSLTGSNVVIRLPDDSNYVLKSQSIDQTLRSIKSMLDYGIIIENDKIELFATKNSSTRLSKEFFKQINALGAVIC